MKGQGDRDLVAPLAMMFLSLCAVVLALFLFLNGCGASQTVETVAAVASAKGEAKSCQRKLSEAVQGAKGTCPDLIRALHGIVDNDPSCTKLEQARYAGFTCLSHDGGSDGSARQSLP